MADRWDDWPKYLPVTGPWRELVVRARDERGWSQHDLADMARVSQTAISNIESGNSKQTEHWREICKALDIPPPVFGIENAQQWAWIRAGVELQRADPEAFEHALAVAVRLTDAALKKEER